MKKRAASPYFIWTILFTIIPLALVIYYAFTTADGGFTFDNIISITKPEYLKAFGISFWLALIATAICLVLGFPIAYIIARASENTQRTMLLLVMLPMWMNFLLRTYAWMTLLEDTGLINQLLSFLHLPNVHMINTQGAIVLGMVYNFLPFVILPMYSVMTKIDNSVIEAAQDLGAGSFHVLTKILIPLAMPGIISGTIMVFVPSVSTFIISRMLGGGTTPMIGDLIEQQFLGSTYNPYTGSALSLVLMVVMLIVMAVMNLFDSEDIEGAMI